MKKASDNTAISDLSEIICRLQNLAHEGYAVHSVEIHSTCDNCDSDVVVDNPKLSIEIDKQSKTVKLKFLKSDIEEGEH